MFKQEENNWNVTVQDAVKINTDEGDTLLVSLPAQSMDLPSSQLHDMTKRVAESFKEVFEDKKVKVIVVPHGMKVELIVARN